MFAPGSTKKRPREDEDDFLLPGVLSTKKSRPTLDTGSGDGWARDSVINTPPTSGRIREQPKYDSDDELSSMVSEPGSPQDVSMSSDDEGMEDILSQSPEDDLPQLGQAGASPSMQCARTNRVPTPIMPRRPGTLPIHLSPGYKQHVRQRHPQEFLSSDHLGPPSPIDEDEIPTPPSAAEAAGSQLSQLSVNDIEMADEVPTISIDPARPVHPHLLGIHTDEHESAIDIEPIDSGQETVIVRKQRQRSGALSSGISPTRAEPNMAGGKRGFSIGFRADCEKCRMRVPGHMNHFIS